MNGNTDEWFVGDKLCYPVVDQHSRREISGDSQALLPHLAWPLADHESYATRPASEHARGLPGCCGRLGGFTHVLPGRRKRHAEFAGTGSDLQNCMRFLDHTTSSIDLRYFQPPTCKSKLTACHVDDTLTHHIRTRHRKLRDSTIPRHTRVEGSNVDRYRIVEWISLVRY